MAGVLWGRSGLRCSWRGRPGLDHTGPENEFVLFSEQRESMDKKITWLYAKLIVLGAGMEAIRPVKAITAVNEYPRTR